MPHLDIEKGSIMTDSKHPMSPSRANSLVLKGSTDFTHRGTTIPLTIAYISLYLTNYYLSPSGPGYHHHSNDSGRIPPLVIILTLLAPDIVQKAFAATIASSVDESPCFGFGWLAFTAGFLVRVVRGSEILLLREQEEEDVKVVGMHVRKGSVRKNSKFGLGGLLQDLESKYLRETGDDDTVIEILESTGHSSTDRSLWTMWKNRSTATAVFQFCLAGLFWYCYRDLSVLLLLSTSILLIEATANLPMWSAQNHLSDAEGGPGGGYALMRDTDTAPRHIFIIQTADSDTFDAQDTVAPRVPYDKKKHGVTMPAFILISGGLLSQALLCTQLSDAAAMGMLVIMFCGTVSNVAIAALPREPAVGGRELKSVDVIVGKRGVVGALNEVESRLEGYGEVLVRQCFPKKLGEWEGRKEKVVRMKDVGEMN